MTALGRDDHSLPSAKPTNEARTRARLSMFVGALFLVPTFCVRPDIRSIGGIRHLQTGQPAHRRGGMLDHDGHPRRPSWISRKCLWYLDVYPTRAAAEKAREAGGSVLESLGKVWLLTIGKPGWRPSHEGERIAEIGPIPVVAGKEYTRHSIWKRSWIRACRRQFICTRVPKHGSRLPEKLVWRHPKASPLGAQEGEP